MVGLARKPHGGRLSAGSVSGRTSELRRRLPRGRVRRMHRGASRQRRPRRAQAVRRPPATGADRSA